MVSLSALDMFMDSLEEGVLFLNRDRQVVAINAAAEAMLGQERGEICGRLCPSVFAGNPCATTCAEHGNCSLTSSAGADRKNQDITLKQPDGRTIFLKMWALLLPEDPQLFCAIVLRDRTREVELEQEVKERLRLGGLIGRSPAMQKLYQQILRAAASEATVLVTGESGTGKELVARALHDNSARSQGPYVAVQCAALPAQLLEAELFGHARGAFTGAASARAGRFEAAQGGTLLLDEIGEMPLAVQVKLLRVLQEREVVRLGENHVRRVNVRVVAATHRDLKEMVQRGEFREDLYYRLHVLPLRVPNLRERKEDIQLLAVTLFHDTAKRYRRDHVQLSTEALTVLEHYDWPGNVRELGNALEYALVQADGHRVQPSHLPPEVRNAVPARRLPPMHGETVLLRGYYRSSGDGDDEVSLIRRMLTQTHGNKTEAARRLGMSRTTLWKRLRGSA